MQKLLRDKRFPALCVTIDTATPHVSLHLRQLYIEFAERRGEKEALERWHRLRVDHLRHASRLDTHAQAVLNELDLMDNTDKLLADWQQRRDEINAVDLGDGCPQVVPVPVKKVYNLEVGGIVCGLLVAWSVGLIGGVIWSYLQRGGRP